MGKGYGGQGRTPSCGLGYVIQADDRYVLRHTDAHLLQAAYGSRGVEILDGKDGRYIRTFPDQGLGSLEPVPAKHDQLFVHLTIEAEQAWR